MRWGLVLLALLWTAVGEAADYLGDAPEISFEIIVHPDHKGSEITGLQLRRIFLRRVSRWPDGRPIVPVNGPPGSRLRKAITHWLFPEGRNGLIRHWNRLYYRGILPPRALASYPAVALMVSRVPGAIGYLPPGHTDAKVSVLRVTDL